MEPERTPHTAPQLVHVHRGRKTHIDADYRRMRTACGRQWVAIWLDPDDLRHPMCAECEEATRG